MVTPDGAWRVERVRDRQGLGYVVYKDGFRLARCATPQQVAQVMAKWGGDIAELVPD